MKKVNVYTVVFILGFSIGSAIMAWWPAKKLADVELAHWKFPVQLTVAPKYKDYSISIRKEYGDLSAFFNNKNLEQHQIEVYYADCILKGCHLEATLAQENSHIEPKIENLIWFTKNSYLLRDNKTIHLKFPEDFMRLDDYVAARKKAHDAQIG